MIRLLPLIAFYLTISLLPHTVLAADSHAVNSGAEVIIEEHGACSQVANNSGKRVFVPTRTPEEWAAFRNNASGVDAAACSYGWVTGNWGSCSETCGGGTRTRSVACERSDGAASADGNCSGSKPTSSQNCNTQSCCIRQPASGWKPGGGGDYWRVRNGGLTLVFNWTHINAHESIYIGESTQFNRGGWTYLRGPLYRDESGYEDDDDGRGDYISDKYYKVARQRCD